jgi:succinylglutamate desuccinylase
MKKIAVVVCLHGDESLGLKIKENLPENIPVFIGNPEAVKENKRYIESDLNRSFPGKIDGTCEEKRALDLLNELKEFDIVIDVHSSVCDFEVFGIVTKPNKEKIELAKKMGLKKVVIMPESFGHGQSLIDNLNCGISLEIGPNGYEENVKEVLKAINNLFDETQLNSEVELFEVIKTIMGEDDADKKMQNFYPVKKEDLIARGKKDYYAEFDFIPIFVGEKAYENVLCLATKKIDLIF